MLALLEPFIKQMLMQGLQQETRAKANKYGAVISLSVLSSFFAFAGVIFLLYGLFEKLLTWYSVPEAALAMGLITFFLSIGTAITAMLVTQHHQKHAVPPPDLSDTVQSAISTLSEAIEDPVRDNPGTALLLAGLAGYLANKHFH